MKTFLALVGVVLAAVVASTSAKAAGSIQEEHPIDWYDCSRKADGNYLHPYDCTRFISCSGEIASQRDCANCDIPSRCRDGRTVYNVTLDQCLWADETECQTDGSGTPPTTRLPSSSSQKPTDPPTVAPTEDNGEITQRTTEETTTTETPNPVIGLPKPGDPCEPELCVNNGTCTWYWRCDNKTREIVEEQCDEGLVWNPLNPDGTPHIHGGNCDLWKNLDPSTEAEYRKDKDCLACFWEEVGGKCSRDYDYQAPGLLNRNVQRLTCAEGLVFSKDKETCRRCQDVNDENGAACC